MEELLQELAEPELGYEGMGTGAAVKDTATVTVMNTRHVNLQKHHSSY